MRKKKSKKNNLSLDKLLYSIRKPNKHRILKKRLKQEEHYAQNHRLIDADTITEFDLVQSGSSPEMVEKARKWIKDISAVKELNATFMDTTTLYTADNLISDPEGKCVSPATLFDLATFVRSVVLYDQIFYLNTGYLSGLRFNNKLGTDQLFIDIPNDMLDHYPLADIETNIPLVGVSEFLGKLFDQTMVDLGELSRKGQIKHGYEHLFLEEIRRSWSSLLGGNVSYDYLIDSDERDGWRSNGSQLVQDLLSAFRDYHGAVPNIEYEVKRSKKHKDEYNLKRFISETNHRAMFNCHLARLLQLPYASSVVRLPFRNYQYHVAKVIQEHLLSIKNADQYYHKEIQENINLNLPIFLAVILERCSNLSDFYSELADLRKMAEPFRLHRQEYEQALEKPKSYELASLREAMEKDVNKLRSALLIAPTAASFSAMISNGCEGTPEIVVGSIGLLTAISYYGAEKQDMLFRRLFKPKEWFLSNIAQEAKGIYSNPSNLRKLWNCDIDDEYYTARFKAFAKLGYC